MDLLSRQEARLRQIEMRMHEFSRAEGRLRHEIRTLNQRKRYKKLVKAGLLFEEAGILDSYDRKQVLQVLQNLRKDSSRKDDGDGR